MQDNGLFTLHLIQPHFMIPVTFATRLLLSRCKRAAISQKTANEFGRIQSLATSQTEVLAARRDASGGESVAVIDVTTEAPKRIG